jgi:hypothetical protein
MIRVLKHKNYQTSFSVVYTVLKDDHILLFFT